MKGLVRGAIVIVFAGALVITGCGDDGGSSDAQDAGQRSAAGSDKDSVPPPPLRAADRAKIPFLLPFVPEAPEGDTPPAVRARLEREQAEALRELRRAAAAPATEQAGCRPFRISAGKSALGPPAPTVHARILGHQVEVTFAFSELPQSAACRPAGLDVVVYNGDQASPTFNSSGAAEQYQLRGRHGRVTVDLPWGGHPPYRLRVSSRNAKATPGRAVEQPLACPGTSDYVRGCLPGYQPPLHRWPLPKPVLPIRGLSLRSLERSMQYVVAADKKPASPLAVRCASLKSCEVTYADPAFPGSGYRVSYAIAGQQLSGCWMGIHGEIRGRLPYPDADYGPLELSACASWVR
jgi:hypothetical protein